MVVNPVDFVWLVQSEKTGLPSQQMDLPSQLGDRALI
jgi:hypothetical protein